MQHNTAPRTVSSTALAGRAHRPGDGHGTSPRGQMHTGRVGLWLRHCICFRRAPGHLLQGSGRRSAVASSAASGQRQRRPLESGEQQAEGGILRLQHSVLKGGKCVAKQGAPALPMVGTTASTRPSALCRMCPRTVAREAAADTPSELMSHRLLESSSCDEDSSESALCIVRSRCWLPPLPLPPRLRCRSCCRSSRRVLPLLSLMSRRTQLPLPLPKPCRPQLPVQHATLPLLQRLVRSLL